MSSKTKNEETTKSRGDEADGNENNGTGNKPLKMFSYPVAKDTWVQASVWARQVTLAGGESFTTHEVSVRKRLKKNGSDEWISVHSFRASELYALSHAISMASAYILELRNENAPF